MAEKRLTVNQNEVPIYDIVFEDSFLPLKEELLKLHSENRKICIITETRVAPLYLEEVKKAIEPACKTVCSFLFEAGEENKNLDTVSDLYEFLIQNQFDRKDLLLALGGGVTGDLTGFGAATYLRGIDFIQVPTTLLAQVDSSIGGKTGVDFRAYKNMVGAFHMPKLVYMNMEVLKTLPEREFNCGLGEIIKHVLIKDKAYLDYIEEQKEEIKNKNPEVLKELIYGSCVIKKGVVERDPKEQGERAMLNFGHTLGHAIEKKMNFEFLHGECVALGCMAALFISCKMGNISKEECEKYCSLIRWFGYPSLPRDISAREIVAITKLDKKMEHGVVKFIVLKELGEAQIVKTVTDDMMEEAILTLNS